MKRIQDLELIQGIELPLVSFHGNYVFQGGHADEVGRHWAEKNRRNTLENSATPKGPGRPQTTTELNDHRNLSLEKKKNPPQLLTRSRELSKR